MDIVLGVADDVGNAQLLLRGTGFHLHHADGAALHPQFLIEGGFLEALRGKDVAAYLQYIFRIPPEQVNPGQQ